MRMCAQSPHNSEFNGCGSKMSDVASANGSGHAPDQGGSSKKQRTAPENDTMDPNIPTIDDEGPGTIWQISKVQVSE
jgi:hypothetical protein